MGLIRKYADNTSHNSISNKFRRKRFEIFKSLIKDLPRPVKILDVGGTVNFWVQMGFAGNADADISLLNAETENVQNTGFKFIRGDARNISMFKDKEFDVVFSNSVIEHVGEFREQKKMADEILRTGRLCFVQTPNYYFPYEPHFLFPFFQFFPHGIKILLLKKFKLGWFEKANNNTEAENILNSVNLLTVKDLHSLFPGAQILKEKFLFLTKSYIIISKK
jgi:SAM-dependent methyltransferase